MSQAEMPPDPTAATMALRVKRGIDAVEWQKREKGISWAKYMDTILDHWTNESFAQTAMTNDQLLGLERWSALISYLEPRADLGVDQATFEAVKPLAMQAIVSMATFSRELMRDSKH